MRSVSSAVSSSASAWLLLPGLAARELKVEQCRLRKYNADKLGERPFTDKDLECVQQDCHCC